MDAKLKERLAQCLTTLKAETEKRDEIYKHGVDLSNYDQTYITELIGLIVFLIEKDVKDEIEWWIYENVEKVYSFNDGTKLNVEKPEDLIQHLIEW